MALICDAHTQASSPYHNPRWQPFCPHFTVVENGYLTREKSRGQEAPFSHKPTWAWVCSHHQAPSIWGPEPILAPDKTKHTMYRLCSSHTQSKGASKSGSVCKFLYLIWTQFPHLLVTTQRPCWKDCMRQCTWKGRYVLATQQILVLFCSTGVQKWRNSEPRQVNFRKHSVPLIYNQVSLKNEILHIPKKENV